MAFYATPRPAAGPVSRAVEGLISEFRAWRDLRETRNALSGLSDKELGDIGLLRADLDTMSASDLHR